MFIINVLLSRVLYLFAKVFFLFNIWRVKTKYWIVLERHSKVKATPTSQVLLKMLVLGEDRKYFYHIGIDIWGIIRALYLNLRGELQGASTITQQYIRTLTNYNEIRLKRKLVEIFLALLLNDKLEKLASARNYLSIAYYGHEMIGKANALIRINEVNCSDIKLAAELIARLKYPEKRYRNYENLYKINRRKNYLYDLYIGNRELSNNFYWKNKPYFPVNNQTNEQILST